MPMQRFCLIQALITRDTPASSAASSVVKRTSAAAIGLRFPHLSATIRADRRWHLVSLAHFWFIPGIRPTEQKDCFMNGLTFNSHHRIHGKNLPILEILLYLR